MNFKTFLAGLLLLLFYNVSFSQESITKSSYENTKYKFKVQIEKDWKVYDQFEDASIGVFIIAWSLPKIYSELEQTDIANAITVTCITQKAIKNVQDLTNFEFARINDVLLSKEKLANADDAYVVYSKISGLNYKSKLCFIFKNGIGYIIGFTATKGTYDKNLSKFEEFYKNMIVSD